MTTTLATVTPPPVPVRARPGDRIRCTTRHPDAADFITLVVCYVAFWRLTVQSRRYSNIVRDVRRYMDEADRETGMPLNRANYARARQWVDHAIAATESPLTVVPR